MEIDCLSSHSVAPKGFCILQEQAFMASHEGILVARISAQCFESVPARLFVFACMETYTRSRATASWCLRRRNGCGVGIDSHSPNHGKNERVEESLISMLVYTKIVHRKSIVSKQLQSIRTTARIQQDQAKATQQNVKTGSNHLPSNRPPSRRRHHTLRLRELRDQNTRSTSLFVLGLIGDDFQLRISVMMVFNINHDHRLLPQERIS